MSVVRMLVAGWRRASAAQASLLAAGVAFYAFLSLFPALIAVVLGYGLFADPATVDRQSDAIADALPADAASLITGQISELTSTGDQSLGTGLVVALALALWSASGGVGNLVTALATVQGREVRGNFVVQKVRNLALTLGAVVVLVALISLVAVAPAVLDQVVTGTGARFALEAVRWTVLLGALVLAVAVLFRTVAPGRRLIGPGVLTCALFWLVVSVGFSVYVDQFGSYAKTYGALAGVVVLLLWLWAGAYALLLGAAVDTPPDDD